MRCCDAGYNGKKMRRILRKVKDILKKIRKKAIAKIRSFDRSVYFSIGENCLSDDILKRNGLKSFSSPYASGRSNIEYILAFEKDSFSDFTDSEYMAYGEYDGKTVLRNRKHVETENRYHRSCTEGFEFTHHDVLRSSEMKETIDRRSRRQLGLKDKRAVMLYHHRYCEDTDMDLLYRHLDELAKIYESRGNRADIYAFMQVLVDDPGERKAEKEKRGSVRFYRFYTLTEWAGEDQDIVWARCDDDLLKQMVDDIRRETDNIPRKLLAVLGEKV